MKIFAFIAVFLALALAVSAADESELPHNDFFTETRDCVPRQQFIDKCNRCTCSPDGQNAACTRKGCPTPEKPHIDDFKPGRKCPPGKTFYDRCNTCRCSKNGRDATCTLIACRKE